MRRHANVNQTVGFALSRVGPHTTDDKYTGPEQAQMTGLAGLPHGNRTQLLHFCACLKPTIIFVPAKSELSVISS